MGDWSQKRKDLKKERRRNTVLNIVCILLAGSGIWATADYFRRHLNYVVTNDASIDQYVAPLNIRVAGYIREVRFTEHQFVHQGDTLLVLDDREYRIRVKEAEAALLDARGAKDVIHSGIETSRTNVAVQDANIAEAKAKLWQTEQDFRRFERLMRDESVPGQQYEQAKASYEAAQARYQALVAQKEAAVSQYSEASKRTVSAEATGSKYSLVPTDNSAGNFVKVQQRIPVRIDLVDVSEEEMSQLRAGMMVETEALRQ